MRQSAHPDENKYGCAFGLGIYLSSLIHFLRKVKAFKEKLSLLRTAIIKLNLLTVRSCAKIETSYQLGEINAKRTGI